MKELQARLRIGPTKAYQLVSSGELPCLRIGRAIRIERQTLEAWIKARERATANANGGEPKPAA